MTNNIDVAVAGGTATLATKDTGVRHLPVQNIGAHTRTYRGVSGAVVLTSTAQVLPTIPALTTHADIYAQGASSSDYARYWHHASTNPTATVGKKLKDHEEIVSNDPANFRVILGSGSVTLFVEYYSYE